MDHNIFADIQPEDVVLPIQVVKEYADLFNSTFKGELIYEIKKRWEDVEPYTLEGIGLAIKKVPDEKSYVVRSYILAPGLDNYRMYILRMQYKVSTVFPCTIENVLEGSSRECKNGDDVKSYLEALFKSNAFRRPIRLLLSQLRND